MDVSQFPFPKFVPFTFFIEKTIAKLGLPSFTWHIGLLSSKVLMMPNLLMLQQITALTLKIIKICVAIL